MLELNKQQREIKINLTGDSGSLLNIQVGIIRLIQCYNFEDYPPQNGEFYWVMNLLEEMLLNDDQIERALSTEESHIKLPKNLTDRQKLEISQALRLIETETNDDGTNPVFKALKKVG